MCLIYVDLNKLTYLYERKEHFFFFLMNETAIELTGQALAPLNNIQCNIIFMVMDKTLTPSP